jgi:hypothetical protein
MVSMVLEELLEKLLARERELDNRQGSIVA